MAGMEHMQTLTIKLSADAYAQNASSARDACIDTIIHIGKTP
jgi:hypothetical protein